jgi:serine/threonine-protein kinase
VKPSNIMACRYGRDLDFVKVLDFGIMTLSKEEREPANPSWSDLDPDFREGLTKGTLVIGTPDYMSPEQAANEPLDAQSDIYALGCVAYYLLTGKLVFPGGTDQEKLARHRHEPPPRPSENTKQHIPPALDDLVVSCLSKRKEDRPRNADQLAAQLLSSVSEPWTVADIQSWWATNDLPKRNTTAATSVSVSEVVQPAQEKHNWVSGAWQRFYELVW